MDKINKVYWKGFDELGTDPGSIKKSGHKAKIHPDNIDPNSQPGSRRDFLKLMGFSLAAASLAACETPVRKAIPYLNKPVDVDPGIPNYYASTYISGGDYCSILVKTRDGRPIKIEGNKYSKISKGGTTAQVEASILSLYDQERLPSPVLNGQSVDWATLDKDVISRLSSIAAEGGQIRIISNTILSPATKTVLDTFLAKYPGSRHVTYDPISFSGMTEANNRTFGKSFIPTYHFEKAEVIVSISADFLTNWINPPAIIRDYAASRKLSKDRPKMSRHYQFETLMSTTGANADYRISIKPSEEGLVVAQLYNLIAAKQGAPVLGIPGLKEVKFLSKAADNLWATRGKALVVAGSNDPDVQELVNGINAMIGSYGTTIDTQRPVNFRQGSDAVMNEFVNELKTGKISCVIFYNSNPVYNHPLGNEIAGALKDLKLSISTSGTLDETASQVNIVAPDHHFLESWNDAEPVSGHLSLSQPVITPLFNTRQAQESFLAWSGDAKPDYYTFLKGQWKEKYLLSAKNETESQYLWDKCLHDGVFELPVTPVDISASHPADIGAIAQRLPNNYKQDNPSLELVFYSKQSIGDGSQGNNPWLHEMPDPISRVSWDHYLSIPVSLAREFGLTMEENETKFANLNVAGNSFKLPVIIQPGQAKGTVALAIGYGRERAGIVGNNVGVNVYPLLTAKENYWSWSVTGNVSVEILNEGCRIPMEQTHHTYMGRTNVIQEDILSSYKQDDWERSFMPEVHTSDFLDSQLNDGKVDGKTEPARISLWKGHEYSNHHWGMIIDMNSCIGCGTCTIACQVENNVPVVGREEVINRREMHWLRIDRYYSSDAPKDDMKGMDIASEDPEVVFQPMLCQQCNNAPCETVCPVAATTHSTEGLNQMVYNRCIGTRYCADNCPYKVRRFNWFKYFENRQFDKNLPMSNDLGRMVLNPDVTVRSRGVMEKCTFCVQRLQAGKLEAKKENRRPVDGEIITACASSCPADAIIFGDLNDPESRVSRTLAIKEENGMKLVMEKRAYNVLEEVNTRPNIWYFAKIRNKDVEDIKA